MEVQGYLVNRFILRRTGVTPWLLGSMSLDPVTMSSSELRTLIIPLGGLPNIAWGTCLGVPSVRIMITWTPKVCKIMAFMAVIMVLGPLFHILWGFR